MIINIILFIINRNIIFYVVVSPTTCETWFYFIWKLIIINEKEIFYDEGATDTSDTIFYFDWNISIDLFGTVAALAAAEIVILNETMVIVVVHFCTILCWTSILFC